MKAVMISIRPEWCEKIANGTKTLEIRKTRPKLETPFKCYIYCTKGSPYLVLGDVFRGNWETEYTTTYGYSREEADRIWGTMNGKVIGEFVCDEVCPIRVFDNGSIQNWNHFNLSRAEIPYDDLAAYIGANKIGYGWHISNLKIYKVYDNLKELTDFRKPCIHTKEDVSCFLCDRSGYAEDMHIDCFNKCYKPPQSWCYVEENTDEV